MLSNLILMAFILFEKEIKAYLGGKK